MVGAIFCASSRSSSTDDRLCDVRDALRRHAGRDHDVLVVDGQVDAEGDGGLLVILDEDLSDGAAVARADDFDQVLAGGNGIEPERPRGIGCRVAAQLDEA